MRLQDQDGAATRGGSCSPALAIILNEPPVCMTRAVLSLDRASLNTIGSERSRDRPPADEGVLTADGRPTVSAAVSGAAPGWRQA